MSTYATALELAAAPSSGGQSSDADRVYVAVNRNTVDDGHPVRLDLEAIGTDVEAYLTATQAEQIADALRDAAGAGPHAPGGYAIPTRAVGRRHSGDEALLALEAEVRRLVLTHGIAEAEVIGRIANGLLGEVNGYRSRTLKRIVVDALEEVRDADEADLKAAEAARWEANR